MLRKLTIDQINDWFTIGKAVSGVELLGGEPRAAAASPPPPQGDGPAREEPPSATEGIPGKKSAGVEYVERYRQLEAEELNAIDNSWPPCEPATSVLSRHKSSLVNCVPVGNYKYPDLPISSYKEQMISLIESNSVVIVRGSTGSGKSTQLPQYVLDHCVQHSTYCNIVVTQPRKIGASSIARWISKQRSWPLGKIVGYQVGLEKVASEDTRLIYVTTGILLQKIVGAKSLSEFTHIFIDEVHERTEELDFLLLVVRKLLRTNSRFVKVILMSATISCQEFANYFAVPVRNKLHPAYVFEVEGKPHTIEEYYLDDLKLVFSHIRIPSQVIDDPLIHPEMYSVAVALIQWFDKLEVKESGAGNPNLEFMSERGSVLVFLPGLAEINYMHELLTDMAHRRLQVYPLHSSVTLEEQNSVFLAPVPGYRKILLSTNIAESSVTVPDVKYDASVNPWKLSEAWKQLSDFAHFFSPSAILWGELEVLFYNACLVFFQSSSAVDCDNGVSRYPGRAGRVSKGYCYRLIDKDFWTHCVPETTTPEILRCPLETTVLKVKLLDMGEPRALLATALSPPSVSEIEHTILRLKEIGALAIGSHSEENNPYDGELTFLGRVLAELPVNQHLGKLIVLGHVFGCLEECLIMAAALSLNNFFTIPFKQHLDGYRNKMHFSGNSRSDCIALVNAFKEWQENKKNGKLRHPKDELDWGRSNCIHIKRIREVAELYEELKERVGKFNMNVSTQPAAMDHEHVYKQRFILQVVMAGAFYPNYFTVSQHDEEIAVKELLGKDPKTTVVLKNIPPYGFLYYKQLQSLFRQCGQVKSISYDGAKAFVEFSRNPTERFKVLPAVYLALKMSQLRMLFELNVHSPEEIESKMGGRTSTTVRSTRVNVDFQKHTVIPAQKLSNALEKLQTISSLDLSINVTEVVEVGHFWGYRIDERSMNILKGLSTEISQLELTPLPVHPYPDLVCLAPFTDWEDERYYRAQILYVSGDSAEVFYVDYGNRSKVALDHLREIPNHLRELPFQALEFKMHRMRPSAHSLVCGEQWSHAASKRFASLVNGCALMVKVFSIVHSILHVDVLRYSGMMEIVNIRDVLIQECHAELAEDSYGSVLSNENLKQLFSMSEANKESGVSPEKRYREEKHLIEMLLENYSASRFSTPNCKATLTGPFNPCSLNFSSMTKVSRFRMVSVEKQSVNSVVVADAPENTFQQILVASSVSVNATGSTIMLRETSLMPHIPGLPALLSMLFAPVIDLRTDENQTRYIGVLCGLGWNHILRTPIFQDHDMELAFDVEIDADDITQINILRIAINKLVSDGPNGFLHFGQERISQLQYTARQKLLGLICKSKPRKVIPPKWYPKSYEWNQKASLQLESLDSWDFQLRGEVPCIVELSSSESCLLRMANDNRAGLAPEANKLVEALKKMPMLHDAEYAKATNFYDSCTFAENTLILPLSKKKKRVIYTILEYSPLVDSCNMTTDDWAKIAKDLETYYEQYDGFVILHGTDTMAYTAAALSFMCENLGKTIILTGAQVPIYELRNDGRSNLLGALLIAGLFVIPEVCLYFHHKLYRGNRVTKVDTGSFDAFSSPNLPPLANAEVDISIDWGIVWRTTTTKKFKVHTDMNRNVGLLRIFPGITATTVRAFLQPPMEGVVLETYGCGNAPNNRPDLLEELRQATERNVVILNCTQCLRGSVTPTYATGQDLAHVGVISGGDMTPEASLAKLSYVLAKRELTWKEKKQMLCDNLRGEMSSVFLGIHSSLSNSIFIKVMTKFISLNCKEELGALIPSLACAAAKTGDMDALKAIEEVGGNLICEDYDGRTPLHVASSEGHVHLTDYLLKSGASVYTKDRYGATPLMNAIEFRHMEIIQLLRETGAHLSSKELENAGTKLCLLAAKGDVEGLKAWHLAGVDMELPDYAGRTPLQVASITNNNQILDFLIQLKSKGDSSK